MNDTCMGVGRYFNFNGFNYFSCKQNQHHVAESMFPVTDTDNGSPVFIPKIKVRHRVLILYTSGF